MSEDNEARALLSAIVEADDQRAQLAKRANRTATSKNVEALICADHKRAKCIDDAREFVSRRSDLHRALAFAVEVAHGRGLDEEKFLAMARMVWHRS